MQKIPQANIRENSTIQAVIFDLDGVLLDSEWMAFQAWVELARRHGGDLKESAFPEMAGTAAELTAEIVMRLTGVRYDIDESVAWAFRRVQEQIRIAADPLPGAVELVREMADRGLPLAIASNSPTSYIDDALIGLNLSPYFPVRVGVEQVAEGKPAPDVYLRAADLTGVPPTRCLVVEDSRVGVQAGTAANMRVLAVPSKRDEPYGFEIAWRTYPSLAQIKAELSTILL